jgi:hypothetical protein
MANYPPELVAAVRHDYLYADKTLEQIAARYRINARDINRMREQEGWPSRYARIRRVPRLTQETQALEEAAVSARPEPGDDPAGMAQDARLPALPAPSAIERIERLVEQELAAEESARGELGAKPRRRADAARCARTLSTLTQTLHALARLRGGLTPDRDTEHDDMPHDIDDFRNELARRIRAFVQSRTGEGLRGPVGGMDGETGA